MGLYDTVIANGIVIDGQNLPRRRADVGIKDGRIAKVGRISKSEATEVIDATDLIVAPGFVDLHTHYDAQLFWDPYCTISGWHGVTSVAIGNCGFGFAPAKPQDREYLMKSLSRVEAIPAACIEASLPWTVGDLPRVDGGPGRVTEGPQRPKLRARQSRCSSMCSGWRQRRHGTPQMRSSGGCAICCATPCELERAAGRHR